MRRHRFLPSPFVRSFARAAVVLALAGAGTAAAQGLDAPLATALDAETRVLPVWSNSSGRIEALLLLDGDDALSGGNALDRVLNAPRTSLGIGTRVRLDGGGQLRSTLQVEGDGGLALLCDGRSGLTAALAALGERCLLATLDNDDPLFQGAARGAAFGLGWQSPDDVLDLSFGLSWLEVDRSPGALSGSLSRSPVGIDVETLGAWAQRLESQNLRVDSLITLGPQARMLIGGDVGRNRMLALDGSELHWDSAALSVGLGIGRFSGQLTGRLIELPRHGQHWNSLDIGVSWRMPWQGELSVGARNVLGGGDAARWPLAELPPSEDPSARVPYVRYQQDL